MSFAKEFKKGSGTIKSGALSMISNGSPFYCNSINISTRKREHNPDTGEEEDRMVFPSNEDLSGWLTNLFLKDLAYKPLPQKALDSMKAKGITPKKQPSQVLNILVTASDTANLVLVHCPKEHDFGESFVLRIFVEKALEGLNFTSDEKEIDTANQVFVTLDYTGTEKSSFKELDQLTRRFFTQLKADGIYEDEPESDEEE